MTDLLANLLAPCDACCGIHVRAKYNLLRTCEIVGLEQHRQVSINIAMRTTYFDAVLTDTCPDAFRRLDELGQILLQRFAGCYLLLARDECRMQDGIPPMQIPCRRHHHPITGDLRLGPCRQHGSVIVWQ